MPLRKNSVLSEYIDSPEVTTGFSKDIKRLAQFKTSVANAYMDFATRITSAHPDSAFMDDNTVVVGPMSFVELDTVKSAFRDTISRWNDIADADELIKHYFTIKTVDDTMTIEKIR